MTKRSSEAAPEIVAKKMRPHPELEAMKAALDILVSNADTHHEEARIAAIDAASELEEQWVSATTLRDKTQVEYDTVAEQCQTAGEYLAAFEASSAVVMLKKARESQMVQTLVDDHDKVQETLTNMQRLMTDLTTSRETLKKTLETQLADCADLEAKHKAAEARVETITHFK